MYTFNTFNTPNVIIVESLDIFYNFSTDFSVLLKLLAILHNLISYLAYKTNFDCKSIIHIDKSNFDIMFIDKIESLYYFKKNCIFEIENENKML